VLQNRIRDVLAARGRLAVDAREVHDQADLYNLGLTSHASVDVMLALEDALGVEFPDEALKRSTFASVRNIEQVVEAWSSRLRDAACGSSRLAGSGPVGDA
jgi:acyl carrier protein